ncbi:hypothetical protein MKX03_028437 [Papaver bracteatum]|nr:hypothetical protein MKX03_028437 [Papaver bracteatum]
MKLKQIIILGSLINFIVLLRMVFSMDDESRTLTLRMIGGNILHMYPKFDYTLTVTPIVTQTVEQRQTCLVKMSVEYEKENEDVPPPHEYTEMAISMNKSIARHLAKKA